MKNFLTSFTAAFFFVLLLVGCRTNPPGTSYIQSVKSYWDSSPINQRDWREFVLWHKDHDLDWEQYVPAVFPTPEMYLDAAIPHDVLFQPLTGIPRAQVIDYCAWRSMRVNQILGDTLWMYRLPSEEEYKLLAAKQKRKKLQKMGIFDSVMEYSADTCLYPLIDSFAIANGTCQSAQFRCIAERK